MPEGESKLRDLQERVRNSNISDYTLLSTDYLNHLNGPIMLFDMVGDMPHMLEELTAWRPKTYVEHFRESGFPDRDLAIEAYALAPKRFREPLEEIIDRANKRIMDTIDVVQLHISQEDLQGIRTVARDAGIQLREIVWQANAIIHGHKDHLRQDQIDEIMAENARRKRRNASDWAE